MSVAILWCLIRSRRLCRSLLHTVVLLLRLDEDREMGGSTRQHKRACPRRHPRHAAEAGHDKKGGLGGLMRVLLLSGHHAEM